MTHKPWSRLYEDPPFLVGEMPVSGRSQPRPLPLPEGFTHDVRFKAAALDPTLGVTAYCEPCDWSVMIEPGHSLDDLQRLVAMHEGVTPLAAPCPAVMGATRCTLPAGHYAQHFAQFGGHSMHWPPDEPVFGTESEPGR